MIVPLSHFAGTLPRTLLRNLIYRQVAPVGRRTWRLFCGGEWADTPVTISESKLDSGAALGVSTAIANADQVAPPLVCLLPPSTWTMFQERGP